jgi:hypothetical protein
MASRNIAPKCHDIVIMKWRIAYVNSMRHSLCAWYRQKCLKTLTVFTTSYISDFVFVVCEFVAFNHQFSDHFRTHT